MRHNPASLRPPADAAASVMAGALAYLHPGDRPLVVDEPAGLLVDTLAANGAAASVWLRRAGGSEAARAWPAAGPFTSAYVRLPKAKDALDFALHAVASVLPVGAEIAVFGANDEGIRSATSHLEVVAADATTVDARRHCRVLMGRRRAAIGGHKTSLSGWRRENEIAIAGGTRRWVSYPGLFAGGGLDEGTALLLEHLPELADTARVLDFGCGTGIIGAGVRMKAPRARIDLLDADAVALQAAGENVPDARFLLGDDLAAAGTVRYHVILSNPPLHDGVAENYGTLERLIGEAPKHLVAGGALQIVVQRRIKASERMRVAFGNVALVAEDGRFRVLRAKRYG